MYDYDYCYECTGYGDGELICRCDECHYNESNIDDDWD